jgi:hypothetical protein
MKGISMTQLAPTFKFYRAYVKPYKKRPLTIKQQNELAVKNAKEAVFRATDIPFEILNKNIRQRTITYPRYMFFALLNRNTKMTLKEIGGLFWRMAWNPILKKNIMCGYNHASIISGLENIRNIEYVGIREEWYDVWVNCQKIFKELQNKSKYEGE